MTKLFNRADLQKAFPRNPRVVASLEKLDDLLSSVDENGRTLTDNVKILLDSAATAGGYQQAHPMLDSISALPNRVGAVEITGTAQTVVRPIDGQDPASLLTRGVAYTVFVGIGGIGTTAERPIVPPNAIAMYLDKTLDPDGQPIIWNGSYWIDFHGVPV